MHSESPTPSLFVNGSGCDTRESARRRRGGFARYISIRTGRVIRTGKAGWLTGRGCRRNLAVEC